MIPERFKFAVEEIKPSQNDHILELGCGNGILIELLAKVITTGKISGIDSSATAIVQASKRNQPGLKEEKIILLNQSIKDSAFRKDTFDKIVSFNVNVFLKNSIREFDIIRDALKPKGKLYTFYQFPYIVDISATEPIINELQGNRFDILDAKIHQTQSTPIIMVVATKS